MAKIGITETVLRDAHQSLIATRMTTDEFSDILDRKSTRLNSSHRP